MAQTIVLRCQSGTQNLKSKNLNRDAHIEPIGHMLKICAQSHINSRL